MEKKFKLDFLKGSAATILGTASSMVFQFLSIMIITRYTSKADFGIYILILAIVHFINIICGMGINLTLVKFISSADTIEKKKVLFPIIVIRVLSLLVISFLFYTIGKSFLHLFNNSLNLYMPYILLIYIVASFRDFFYNLMQGLKLFKKYAFVQLISAICRFIILYVYIKFNTLTLSGLIYLEFISIAIPVTLQLILIPFKQFILFKIKFHTYVKIIKFSIPLYLNNIIVFLNEQIGIFIIGAFLNPISIAYYDVSQKIPEALRKMFRSFIIVYFPNLSKLFSEGRIGLAKELINKSLLLFSIITTSMATLSLLFGKEIMVLIFSEKYTQSTMAFSFLMLNFYFRVMADTMGYSFVPAGHNSIPFKVNAISSILCITSSFILIPILGIMGAVYSLMIMNIISMVIYYIYLVKYNLGPNLIKFLQPFIILTIIICLYYLFPFDVICLKLLYLAIFILTIWFLIDDFRNIIIRLFGFIHSKFSSVPA